MKKTDKPKYIVGFSAETGKKINAKKKLYEKNCDMIIYNQISNNNTVFCLIENKISIITKERIKDYAKTSKVKCAKYIVESIYKQIKK